MIQRSGEICAAAFPPKLRQNAGRSFHVRLRADTDNVGLAPFSAIQPLPPRLPAMWRSIESSWPFSGIVPETCTDVALLVAAAAAATMASAGFEATPFVFLVDPPQPALATIKQRQ